MSAARSYLDHNATSPVRPEVAAAMARALALPGNASSVHAEGRAARSAVEQARERGRGAGRRAAPGTSSSRAAARRRQIPVLTPVAAPGRRGGRIAASSSARPSTPACSTGTASRPVRWSSIPVDGQGVVDLAWLAARLAAGGRRAGSRLASSGQQRDRRDPAGRRGGGARASPWRAPPRRRGPGRRARSRSTSQALGADVLTLSAHKLGGPKGVGAIVLASDQIEIGDRLIRGGGQERGYRAGTENVAGIVGFGVAAELAGRDRDGLRPVPRPLLATSPDRVLPPIAPDAVVFGAQTPSGCRTPSLSRSPASAPRRR